LTSPKYDLQDFDNQESLKRLEKRSKTGEVEKMAEPKIVVVSGPADTAIKSATLQRALERLRGQTSGGIVIEAPLEYHVPLCDHAPSQDTPKFWGRPDADTAARIIDGKEFVGLTEEETAMWAERNAYWGSLKRPDPDAPTPLAKKGT
jgi:hypothetical protein